MKPALAELPLSLVSQRERVQKLIGPDTKQKLTRIAPAFSAHARQLPPTADLHALAIADVRSGFQGSANLSEQTIEALAFLVIMQAAKDTQADLKTIMNQTKKSNSQKPVQRAAPNPKGNDKDTLSELGQEESMRLQMAMDRQSKFLQTLSNMEKKIADTNAAVIQNMK